MLSGQIDDLQHEKGRQDELINDANTAIEELTLEKHDYAAKLKHLMQVYVLNLSQSQDRSSYKGDDSSLSINDCFCKIQNKFEQGRLVDNGVDLGQLLDLVREDGSTENKENEGVNGKQDLLKHKQAVKGMADRLGHVEEVLQMQNELVDQHIQKMEAAKLKLENYKARLAEKEHQAQGLQLRVKVLEEQAIELNQDKLI